MLTAGLIILIYQATLYHESSLTNFLQSLSIEEWERAFIHLSPRVAFYVKKYYLQLRQGDTIIDDE